MELVGRSQWFTMCVEHAKYVIEFTKEHPKVRRFFKHTWGPDEYYFHTILFNSRYKSQLNNNNLRYIDWTEGKDSPKTLTGLDYHNILNSGKYFARKFNVAIDESILNKLDLDNANQ